MRVPVVIALTALFGLGSAATAGATTALQVSKAGSDAGNCQASPCATFGYAITQSRLVGDLVTIHAGPGTYVEDLALNGADSGLSIVGAGSGADPGTATIIQGVANADPAIGTTSMASLGLSHLRVTTTPADTSDALLGQTSVVLDDVAVAVAGTGAGIHEAEVTMAGGSVTLTNTASSGFGVYSDGGLSLTDTPVVSAGLGFGIYATAGTLTLLRSPVTLSSTTGSGFGVYLSGAGSVSVTDSAVSVAGTGFGVYASSGPITVANSPVTVSNSAGSGFGVYASGASAKVSDSPVVVKGGGYGVYASSTASVTRSPITLDNTSTSGFGIYASTGPVTVDASPLLLRGLGYGVYAGSGSVKLTNSAVTLDNPASSGTGVQSGSSAVVELTGSPVDVAGTGNGVYAGTSATLTGSPVTQRGTGGSAMGVFATNGGAALTDSPVLVKSTGAGVYAANGPITALRSPVTADNAAGTVGALYAGGPNTSITATDSKLLFGGSSGSAVIAPSGAVTLTTSPVTVTNAGGSAAGVLSSGNPVTVDRSDIEVRSSGAAVQVNNGTMALSRSAITMTNAAGTLAAIYGSATRVSLSGVTVSGAWHGPTLQNLGSTTVTDSTLSSGAGTTNPLVVAMDGGGAGRELRVVRSTLRMANPAQRIIQAQGANVLVDSSLLLGGAGAVLDVGSGTARALTVISSTVDAGSPGVRDAGPGVKAQAANAANTFAVANVLGSILVEPPAADRGGASGSATVNCSTTEVPSTTQAPSGAAGAINCAAGSKGNTSTAALAAIFAAPGSDYAPNPSFSGVDSVAESAVTLPGGAASSAQDVNGNPRVLNAVGTCAPGTRDKGAVELTGHAGVVPAPVITGPAAVAPGVTASFGGAGAPNLSWAASDGATGTGASFTHAFGAPGTYTVTLTGTGAAACVAATTATVTVGVPPAPPAGAPVITNLKLSPTSFVAARTGPTAVAAARKKVYGTVVSYTDSAAARTTFSVSYTVTGRRKGKSCAKQTKANRKAKPCKLTVTVGSFTRTDKVGANRFRFTGRLGKKRLARRTYKLTATPKTTVIGKPVRATFKVKG